MKKYVKPRIEVEVFRPNQLVAACGYKFSCNVRDKDLFGKPREGNIYIDVDGDGKLNKKVDQCITSKEHPFHACMGPLGGMIEKEWNPNFYHGFYVPIYATGEGIRPKNVIIWEDTRSEWNIHAQEGTVMPQISGRS